MRSRDQYISVVLTRNPTGDATMNLIAKSFFPQKPCCREHSPTDSTTWHPGRLLLSPHSHTLTVAGKRKRDGARALPYPRKLLHYDYLSHRHHIVQINLYRCGLPNEANTQHQSMPSLFAQENPVHSLQRASNHFHLHAFVQIWRRMIAQRTDHACLISHDQLFDWPGSSGLFRLSGISSSILDAAANDSVHLVSCLHLLLTKIPSPAQRECEKPGIDSMRLRRVQPLGRDVPSPSALKKDVQSRR